MTNVDTCTWEREGYYYSTNCGHTHNPYIRNLSIYPIIVDDICPYCGKPIEYSRERGNYDE